MKNFVIIFGAMKCGSTSLFEYLSQHPQVCASKPKEPSFFSKPDWVDGLDRYYQYWPDYNPDIHTIRLEASQSYSKTPHFPDVSQRIEQFIANNPGVKFKFIYIMRDPLLMIESAFRQAFDKKVPLTRTELISRLIACADFPMQLGNYTQRFPREDIFLVLLEELASNPSTIMQNVGEFLDLDQSFKYVDLNRAHNKVSDRHRIQIKKILWSSWFFRPIANLIPKAFKTYTKSFVLDSAFRLYEIMKKNKFIPLTTDEKLYIMEVMKPKILEMHSSYGIDMSKWESLDFLLESNESLIKA